MAFQETAEGLHGQGGVQVGPVDAGQRQQQVRVVGAHGEQPLGIALVALQIVQVETRVDQQRQQVLVVGIRLLQLLQHGQGLLWTLAAQKPLRLLQPGLAQRLALRRGFGSSRSAFARFLGHVSSTPCSSVR